MDDAGRALPTPEAIEYAAAWREPGFDAAWTCHQRYLWRAFSILRCPPFERLEAGWMKSSAEWRRTGLSGKAVDVTADCARGFDPALEEGWRQTSSALRVLKNVSTMALSKQFRLALTSRSRDAVLSQLQPGTRRSSIGCHGPRGGMSLADGHCTATARRRANNASSLWSRSPAAQPTTRRSKEVNDDGKVEPALACYSRT